MVFSLPNNKDSVFKLSVLSAINFTILKNGINKIIPAAPHKMPPTIITIIIASVFIFNRLPTAKGNMIFASRIWTIVKTRIIPKGYQIES